MFLTGSILFVTQAEKAMRLLTTGSRFVIKMILILLAALNAAWYQWKYYPNMDEWDRAEKPPLGPKICAIVSLVCWAGVIACGRTMAYEF